MAMDQHVIFTTLHANIFVACDEDRADLADFCRDNPEYDLFLTGQMPVAEDWAADFMTDLPPASFGWRATHKLIARPHQDPGTIAAVMDVTLDMLSQGVAHIGLFQVATKLHGSGLAHTLYQGLEAWLTREGMDVIRLGVLDGNARGMAFWTRHGFRATRHRHGTAPSGKTHLSHVLYKPLKPLTLQAYRARVPRDDPASP